MTDLFSIDNLHTLPTIRPALSTVSAVASLNGSGTTYTPQQVHTLTRVMDCSAQLAAAIDLNEAVSLAMTFLADLTGLGSIVVYHVSAPDHPLRLIGERVEASLQIPPAQMLFIEDTAAGYSLRTQQTLVSPDAAIDEVFGQRMIAAGVCAALTIPMILRGQSVGVVQISNVQAHPFAPFIVVMAERIVQQLALTLDSILLRQGEIRQRARAELLQMVSLVALSINDITETMEIALQLLVGVLPHDQAFVTMLPGTIGRIASQYEQEHPQVFVPALRLPIVDEVVRTWSYLQIVDTHQSPEWDASAAHFPETRSYVGAPLFHRDRVFGVVNFLSNRPYAFNEEDVSLIQTLANQFADAIEKALVFRRMQQREKVADDLVQMGLMLSTTLDEAKLLELICEHSLPIFDVGAALIWLIDETGKALVGAAAYGANIPPGFVGRQRELAAPDSFAASVIRERRPNFINNVQASPAISVRFKDELNIQAVMGIPFLRGNTPLGVLILADLKERDRFTNDDLEQVHFFGVQAAFAIENARLFAETRHRVDQLRFVNEMGRTATSIIRLDALFGSMIKPLFDYFQSYAVSLLLKEDDGQLAIYALFVGEQAVPIPPSRRFPGPESAACRALTAAEPILIRGSETLSVAMWGANDGAERKNGPTCEVALPLMIADEVIGVLNFESRRLITSDDVDVMEPLASQVAFSVSNSRLFGMVRQQVVELDSRVVSQTLALREQKEHIEAILESVADAVITTDLIGQIVEMNPAARAFMSEAHATMHDELRDLVQRLFNSDRNEHTVTIEHGRLALQAKAGRVRESGQDVGAVIVLRDITPLREVDKLKTQFVSTVSHELRTPLSNIKLYLKLLETGKPEKRQSYMNVLDRESNRLERLIIDLLDLSRLEQRAPRQRDRLDLATLIKANVELNLEAAHARGQKLFYGEPILPIPPVIGDKDQLAQILVNLIGNAMSYTPSGGVITLTCVERDGSVRVTVQDTGVGISAEEKPFIFDRFYRGKNVQRQGVPGTGLGLAICKEIIGLHGGEIGVESKPGEGSLFWFTLPIEVAPSAETAATNTSGSSSPSRPAENPPMLSRYT